MPLSANYTLSNAKGKVASGSLKVSTVSDVGKRLAETFDKLPPAADSWTQITITITRT